MEKKNNFKAWLYLLPALILLFAFMLYPLYDVSLYSFQNNYDMLSQTFDGFGITNYVNVLKDPEFISALKNTLLMVIITVPLSTIIALAIAVALNSIKPLKKIFQTIFFFPYVTNTLAVGLVFMIIFDYKDSNMIGLFNTMTGWFGIRPIDWIDGSYLAKMCVYCAYIIWTVLPFKILVLVGALQSVKKDYYQAAQVDGASRWRQFRKITVPMISPMLSYLIITGFIGAFKDYSNAVALFGEDLAGAGMNTIVGYIYSTVYGNGSLAVASSAAIILFAIVLTITVINLFVSEKHVHY